MTTTYKFQIKNRWTGSVQFECDLDVALQTEPFGLQLCAAVKLAIKSKADLAGANLAGANLARAHLAGADLADANLAGANLAGANLARANLAGAYLAGAYLAGAYLARANLAGAYLADANLAGAKNLKLPHFQIPQEGALIVWKSLRPNIIAKLEVPADAKRTASVIGRKCRAEFVKVLAFYNKLDNLSELPAHTIGTSTHDRTEYRIGETIRPDKYDDNPLVECTSGIHFFITREEALEW